MYVCMYVCMYICIMYVCLYVCMYVRTYVCSYLCTCVCIMYVLCMYSCMYVCMYVRTYVCTYLCAYVCTYVCKTCPWALHKVICGSIQLHVFLTLALHAAGWSASLPSCFIPGILWGKNLVTIKNPRPVDHVAYSLIDNAALAWMFVCGFLPTCLDHARVCFCVYLYMDYL